MRTCTFLTVVSAIIWSAMILRASADVLPFMLTVDPEGSVTLPSSLTTCSGISPAAAGVNFSWMRSPPLKRYVSASVSPAITLAKSITAINAKNVVTLIGTSPRQVKMQTQFIDPDAAPINSVAPQGMIIPEERAREMIDPVKKTGGDAVGDPLRQIRTLSVFMIGVEIRRR